MKYILTNEYAHSFPKKYADIIISEFQSFKITKKFINKTVSGFGIGDYAIFIEINTKEELRNVLDKWFPIPHLETFVYYKGETYPEIIINEEILNTYVARYNALQR